MKLGQDISIAECRRSGYMVMEYKKRDLIKNGVLDKDCEVEFSVSNPEQWNDAGKPMIVQNAQFEERSSPLYSLNPTVYTFNELIDFLNYGDRRKGIESCSDWEHCQPNLENPNEYDLLNLANDIHFYCGINVD